jgi:hypothetical protein
LSRHDNLGSSVLTLTSFIPKSLVGWNGSGYGSVIQEGFGAVLSQIMFKRAHELRDFPLRSWWLSIQKKDQETGDCFSDVLQYVKIWLSWFEGAVSSCVQHGLFSIEAHFNHAFGDVVNSGYTVDNCKNASNAAKKFGSVYKDCSVRSLGISLLPMISFALPESPSSRKAEVPLSFLL